MTDFCFSSMGIGGINLLYQNVHDISQVNQVIFSECLVRFHDLDGNSVNTKKFISMLESVELAPFLDRYVLMLAIELLENNSEAVLSINVSAQTFNNDAHFEEFFNLINLKQSIAKRLIIELTETYPIKDISKTCIYLQEIRRLNYRIAVDDFGSGFGSPLNLCLLPCDIIKLDAQFLQMVSKRKLRLGSLSHLINYAASFDAMIVIEGVEESNHLSIARSTCATGVQGYYLSIPSSLLTYNLMSN